MTPAQQRLVASLHDRFGPKAATTDSDVIAPWLTDWRGRFHGAAPAMLTPGSTEEVATAVAQAYELGVALVPQGGNTSMVGGATPPADGSALILSLRRLNRIRSIDAEAGLAVAEAGVILQTLHEATVAAGWRFPLTLGARGSATIGGLVSTNAGGTQVLRWGNMRALVAGIEAVLPDGSLHEGLVALKKDNRGYDLTQLLVGAEGTLGVVTAATLRLAPAIDSRAAAWAGVASPHDALALLRRIEARTTMVESFEIIAGDTLDLVLQHVPDTRSPLENKHRWHVLIEAVAPRGAAEDPAVVIETLLGEAIEAGLVGDATIAASEAQAERAAGPAVQHDVSVPVAGMPDFMVDAAAAAEAAFPGTHATAFGHLGDGNVHFHVRAPAGSDRDAFYAEDAHRITRFVHDLVVAAGGSISAEHGIGQMKLDELARLGPPARIAVLRGVKRGLDPTNLFNPGKLVPLAAGDWQA